MYPHTLALARRIGKPIVAFDLEHTGTSGELKGITEFGAMVVGQTGDVSSYTSLVKPPATTSFNAYVCRLTGIYPETVENAPGWAEVLHEFVLPYQDALWVGFNSRASDTPLIRQESHRLGHELGIFDQLDLMRLPNTEGGLAKRLAALVPDFDTSGAHRALKDAVMTLALLEAHLPTMSVDLVESLRAIPAPKLSTGRVGRAPQAKRKLDVSQFLVTPGISRNGHPWGADEVIWLRNQFSGTKKTVAELAALNGRSAYGIACALFKEGLITEQFREQYRRRAV